MIPRPNSKAIDRKRRLALPIMDLPIRSPSERVADFDEAYGSWDLDTARREAERCIQCPAAPCVKACPLGNDIPYALWLLEHGDVDGAASVFRSTSTMPEICGRVCPQSELCEGACPYSKQGRPPVPIGRLEAFATDRSPCPPLAASPATGHRAAVVGAGPAGLTVAERLREHGHEVCVFDAWPTGGGILRYGIPTFKMDHGLVDDRLARLSDAGVEFVYDTVVGRDLSVDDLFDRGFETVFLGIGAGMARSPAIDGADLPGVQHATPFLVSANVESALRPESLAEPPVTGRRIAVIGGGDTAMDCVRTAVRLGAEATCWYRRTEAEMPGNVRDRALARGEGASFEWLVQPVAFLAGADGRVAGMRCVRMELGEPDDSGRRRPVEVAGSEFEVEVDAVILALGYEADRQAVESVTDMAVDRWSLIEVNPSSMATTRNGVFAGGDAVSGPALVVTAVEHARRAAEAMHHHMTTHGVGSLSGGAA